MLDEERKNSVGLIEEGAVHLTRISQSGEAGRSSPFISRLSWAPCKGNCLEDSLSAAHLGPLLFSSQPAQASLLVTSPIFGS